MIVSKTRQDLRAQSQLRSISIKINMSFKPNLKINNHAESTVWE